MILNKVILYNTNYWNNIIKFNFFNFFLKKKIKKIKFKSIKKMKYLMFRKDLSFIYLKKKFTKFKSRYYHKKKHRYIFTKKKIYSKKNKRHILKNNQYKNILFKYRNNNKNKLINILEKEKSYLITNKKNNE
jgi:hypothetical protein